VVRLNEKDYDREMKEKAKRLKEAAKKLADDIGDDIQRIDVEKETIELMKGFEGAFTSISDEIKRMRVEMEERGVEETVRKDADNLQRTTKKVAVDILDGLEKAAQDLRKELDKDGK
jgi:gas vesicle protein